MNFCAILLFALFLGSTVISFAHDGHSSKVSKQQTAADKEIETRLEAIKDSYKKNVKSILQRSCFDCHSQSPNLPWYHSLPLVRDLLESDMKEAKIHLDFSNDFPFKGHGSPMEDLKAIGETIEDKSMPPFRYKIMHWNSGLSEEERKTVLKWIDESQAILNPSKDKD